MTAQTRVPQEYLKSTSLLWQLKDGPKGVNAIDETGFVVLCSPYRL